LLGEELAQEAARAMGRHSQEQTMAVLRAARQAAADAQARGQSPVRADGNLSPEVVNAVRSRLDDQTLRAFVGAQGERDLAALAAAGIRAHKQARPEEFQRAMARTPDGQGEQSPGRTVPRALGLDPVASQEYFASMNRFARMSEQAGLTPEQRQQLLKEVQQRGQVSDKLRQDIEMSLRRQGSKSGLTVDDLEAGAQALPQTLRGPVAVRLPGDARQPIPPAGRSGENRKLEGDEFRKDPTGMPSSGLPGSERGKISSGEGIQRRASRPEPDEVPSVPRGRLRGGIG
jgi:hypothetical protein